MTTYARLLLLLLACISLFDAPAVAQEAQKVRRATTWETHQLRAGSAFATPVHVQDTGKPGPTVLIVSGLHGDEPASAYAADQVRHWPLLNGRLVVVPRANEPALRAGKRLTPGVSKAVSNANRNFPLAKEKSDAPARGELAQALWALLRSERPQWVLDLHEGFDVHKRNPKSVGRTIIVARDKTAIAMADKMLADVNATIRDPKVQFERLTSPIDGSLARAAATHAGARAMILETATKGLAVSSRARQMRILVHRCLRELKMLGPNVKASDIGYRKGVRAKTVIGVYDGGGTGGSGVARLLLQLPKLSGVAVARIGPTEIKAGALNDLDAVVFSGGMGGAQSRFLGADGRASVRRFVKDGGGYVGICAGAYLACKGFKWGLGILDARTKPGNWRRGKGTVQMQLTKGGRALLADRPAPFGVLYANGPILAPANADDVPDYETLATYNSELALNGSKPGIMVGSPAAVRGRFGKGRVICFGPHPEQTKGLHDLVRRAARWAVEGDN